jgi:hypothetical protein
MTAAEIAETLAMALSTVSLILKRVGLGRRSRLQPLEPVNPLYEHERPGELVPPRRHEARVSWPHHIFVNK